MIDRDRDADLGSSPAERLVHQVLKNLGELLPETADDVSASEKFVAGPLDLPAGLRDPGAVFDRKVELRLPPLTEPCAVVDRGVVDGLRAAARNGHIDSTDLEKLIENDDWNDDDASE